MHHNAFTGVEIESGGECTFPGEVTFESVDSYSAIGRPGNQQDEYDWFRKLLHDFARRERQHMIEQSRLLQELERWHHSTLASPHIDGQVAAWAHHHGNRCKNVQLTQEEQNVHIGSVHSKLPFSQEEQHTCIDLTGNLPFGEEREEQQACKDAILPKATRRSVEDLKKWESQRGWREHMAITLGWKRMSGSIDTSQHPKISQIAYAIVSSWQFNVAVMLLIILNALFIAREQDLSVRKAFGSSIDLNVFSKASNVSVAAAFTSMFSVELLVRLIAARGNFCCGPDKGWNCFDCILVLASLLEMTASSLVDVNFSLQPVRILRSLRGMRFIRILRYFRELRIMMLSILHCMVPLLWFSIFIAIIVFIFGTFFAEQAAVAARNARADDTYIQFFCNFPRTLLTLYSAALGGEDWFNAVTALEKAGQYPAAIVFIVYMTFTYLGVMNIITGIFVETTFNISHMDKEVVMQAEMAKKVFYMDGLRKLFSDFDADPQGRSHTRNFLNKFTSVR